jgi:hypothetical protein
MARNNLKRSNRGITSADLAEHSPFPADGVSQYSHEASNNAPRINPFKPVRFHGRHTLAQQIAECERRIAHMECELRLCERSEKDKRDRLNHDLAIRYRFLTKLMIERGEP